MPDYTTPSGIVVSRTISKIPYLKGLKAVLRKLDSQRGIYLSSGYEYPGRYDARWDVAAVAPPIEIVAMGREITIRPLNERGEALNRPFSPANLNNHVLALDIVEIAQTLAERFKVLGRGRSR